METGLYSRFYTLTNWPLTVSSRTMVTQLYSCLHSFISPCKASKSQRSIPEFIYQLLILGETCGCVIFVNCLFVKNDKKTPVVWCCVGKNYFKFNLILSYILWCSCNTCISLANTIQVWLPYVLVYVGKSVKHGSNWENGLKGNSANRQGHITNSVLYLPHTHTHSQDNSFKQYKAQSFLTLVNTDCW